jgi:hypothetical protein
VINKNGRLAFSDRVGVTKLPDSFQVDTMSDELRNNLWNLLFFMIHDDMATHYSTTNLMKSLAVRVFKIPFDALPASEYDRKNWMKKEYFKDTTP